MTRMQRAEAKEVTRVILAFVRAWAKGDERQRKSTESLLEDDIERCLADGFGR